MFKDTGVGKMKEKKTQVEMLPPTEVWFFPQELLSMIVYTSTKVLSMRPKMDSLSQTAILGDFQEGIWSN